MRNSALRYGALAILLILVIGLASVRMGADANTVTLVGGLACLLTAAVTYTIMWLNPRITILRLDRRTGYGNKFNKRGGLYITLDGTPWQRKVGFEASQISVTELIELRKIKLLTPFLVTDEQLADIMLVTSEILQIEDYIEDDPVVLRSGDQIVVIHGDVARLALDFSRPVNDIQQWAQNAPEVWFQLVSIISVDEGV